MPRLMKLDLFSTDVASSERNQDHLVHIDKIGSQQAIPPDTKPTITKPDKIKSPIFIPVGFTKRELSALEHTVFQLRQKGHREVSKSALIRSLIRLHETSLDTIWLEEKERARTNKLAPNL